MTFLGPRVKLMIYFNRDRQGNKAISFFVLGAPGQGGGISWSLLSLIESFQALKVAGWGPFTILRRLRHLRLDQAYGISALVGVVTYLAYGALNGAWSNPALVGISLYMFLFIPGYSKLSNRVERLAAEGSGLETVGRICRYLTQLGVNLALLWVFLAGDILDPAGLADLGGFFGAAAWITIVSQGGQYLATWLARNGFGRPDLNVVLAVSTSAVVNALAVSGVAWLQPIYLVVSLSIGLTVLSFGLLSDARNALARPAGRALP